jgi:hypothetical protein
MPWRSVSDKAMYRAGLPVFIKGTPPCQHSSDKQVRSYVVTGMIIVLVIDKGIISVTVMSFKLKAVMWFAVLFCSREVPGLYSRSRGRLY